MREGERQLEKIYPRVVKGKDIGVPRLAADEMDAGFHAGPLEGMRTDGWTDEGLSPVHRRSRCSQPYGRPRAPHWGAGGVVAGAGRCRWGEGLRSRPPQHDSSPRVGSARRPMREHGFQRSWKPRIAGSSSMRAGLSRVSRRCMRFLGFHFFLASVSFENSRIIGSSRVQFWTKDYFRWEICGNTRIILDNLGNSILRLKLGNNKYCYITRKISHSVSKIINL